MASFVYVIGSPNRAGVIGSPNRAAVTGDIGKTAWRTYVGWTVDLEKRLTAHNAGTGAKSTRGRKWVLLYAEKHPTRADAMRREWRLKKDRNFRKVLAARPVSP